MSKAWILILQVITQTVLQTLWQKDLGFPAFYSWFWNVKNPDQQTELQINKKSVANSKAYLCSLQEKGIYIYELSSYCLEFNAYMERLHMNYTKIQKATLKYAAYSTRVYSNIECAPSIAYIFPAQLSLNPPNWLSNPHVIVGFLFELNPRYCKVVCLYKFYKSKIYNDIWALFRQI